MFYTVGRKDLYENYIDNDPNPSKLGRGTYDEEYYEGGSIWKTQELAQNYLNENNLNNYSVYGVICNLEDVEFTDLHYGSLLKTSKIVRI